MHGQSIRIADAVAVAAPDGSTVHVLVRTQQGSMARFTLPPFAVSHAVAHRTVDELWYFIAGTGRMWLRAGDAESMIDVAAGVSVAIPAGTVFQFRSDSAEPLQAIGTTMPPWPGESEAVVMQGPWQPTAHCAGAKAES